MIEKQTNEMAEPEMVAGSDVTVLIIDDELGPRESIRFLFKDIYNVVMADNVDDGLAIIKARPPEVIILDIKMEGKSGIEGLREIREIEPYSSIIMLTGFASIETVQQALRYGANDYLRKPFEKDELRDTVRKYVAQTLFARRKARAAREIERLAESLKQQLAQKERLAELGRSSSEFVHDLRNPLSVIYGYVGILKRDLKNYRNKPDGATEVATEYLTVIERNVDRCENLLKEWQDTQNQASRTRVDLVDVGRLVSEAVENCVPLAEAANAKVTAVNTGAPDCQVAAGGVELQRALHNLLTNSLQALPEDGGVVKVGWKIDGNYVDIFVEDNGKGIPPSDIDQVLTPYFTTKKSSGGMGLGLYITAKIMESYGGSFSIENNADRGVTAKIHLPCI